MSFKAVIDAELDADFLKSFGHETSGWDRAAIKAEKHGRGIKGSVEAKDAAAFRAAINSITSLISIYVKSEKIAQNG